MMKMSEQEFIEISEMVHEWRDVVGYEGLYKVSEYGDVLSLNYNHTGNKKLLKQNNDGRGYLQVDLYKNGSSKKCKIHKIVATAFCEGADYFSVVNHMDEDKTNNHYSNLEWCTSEYNTRYSLYKVEKRVKCVELNKEFKSLTEAAKYTNIKICSISACVTGKQKTAGGYHWEYVD